MIQKKINKEVKYAVFKSKLAQNDEYFLALSPETQNFETALKESDKLYSNFLKETKLSENSQIFCRFFLSDVANQKETLLSSKIFSKFKNSGYSIIQQSPLNGSKISIFSYHIKRKENKKESKILDNQKWQNTSKIFGQNYDLLFASNLYSNKEFDSEKQTNEIFSNYNSILKENQTSLLQNCIRTWIYVRDVDNHYCGMVKARGEFFEKEGLNKNTHFIASTGIEGKSKEKNSLVSMDALSISNLDSKQIIKMEAINHLNPTHEYGVTFERGTKVEFGDRSHLYISGTASINNKGEVIYLKDIQKQTLRVLENIKALLKPHKANLSDMMYLIVYLRNITDVTLVKNILDKKGLNKLPIFFVEGAVCRPEWLVEIEGMAIIESKTKWPVFF